ncbi:suppressor of cytokine signaling 2-like [Daktulosphaira vitifoliae]|uniref:suppressor of cytokine signaling 2-like n=1 Tax=Daktulosphaira vitifoliae TaxID=58002 RepID=UPI0021AA1348|nr:suppressor of cytokine signaling 2-like [Daktulosphaira vitifoliae]XP_050520514.1 suppressor of cytokine signaling 2-like [Daktulosphaira vitifoliae]XP_050520515.1 suppressor of cytokine signaling 2-like [Daktulosphaira vitifoliae]XP_050520516.1 suppressor of cytokine signaling 2-like [Daktulosphaira vitifoliae]XP_050520517.1 suppressor of cytokine signaling 2-like [Daktulosphaira vitifoliae]XP_050520518.1 suppressor of cytokine signaling 2-like [Daktulosphaira vitifoliae]XP_050548201.1 su
MLNTVCRVGSGDQLRDDNAASVDLDKSLWLQACWIRLWDRWAFEQRNQVLYQMYMNHALSRERSKLTLAGGRIVSSRSRKPGGRGHAPSDRYHRNSPSTTGGVDVGVRDLRVLSAAVDKLRASGWYYEGAESQARASNSLTKMPAGGFYVRDSKHPGYLFTMDIQTADEGQLSVRFTYSDGVFGLDSMPRLSGGLQVPKFRCPIELIDYYVRLSRIDTSRRVLPYPAWTNRRGQCFSWMNLQIPMIKTDAKGFPSLKHLARLVINRHKCLITITPTSLPNELIEYLIQYPYSL